MLVQNNSGTSGDKIHVLEVLGNAIIGGMEIYVRNLIRQLPSSQFQVTCLCPYESAFTAVLRQMGCAVFMTPMQDDPPWRSIQLTVEIIRSQGIDLIHAHLPKAHVLAGLAGSLTRTPVIATIHGMTLTTQELGISRTTGSHLVVVCQEAYIHALALGVPPERVSLIPNGVDLKTFKPNAKGENFRTTLGVPPDAPLVGFVGRLALEKGPDQFLRAVEHVHRERPDVHFALVGEGPLEDKLVKMIQEMDLVDHVHLAGLWTNTWEVYPAFDILAQTSRVEGMPLVLLEAMACGLPVVAINVGGVAELVEVGTTGILKGPGDWEGIGNAILELLAHPEQLESMGQAGHQRAKKLFDLQTSIHLTSDLFSQLANSKLSYQASWLSTWPAVNGAR